MESFQKGTEKMRKKKEMESFQNGTEKICTIVNGYSYDHEKDVSVEGSESGDHEIDKECESIQQHFHFQQESDNNVSGNLQDTGVDESSNSPSVYSLKCKSISKVSKSSDHILEPACVLAEEEYFPQGCKARFNLRKRSQVQSHQEDYYSDDIPDLEETRHKKLKFNFIKKNYRHQRAYTNEALKEAVKTVHSKRMSILEASRQFDIPRTSLHNFVRLYKRGRRFGVRTLSPGLTKEEEDEMVSLVIKLSRCGKRYSHNELRFLIQYYLINNDRPVFKSGTLPTMGWIAGLVERQPELNKAKSKKNTKVAVEDVKMWQKQIEDYLINDWDLNIEDLFHRENGHRIFCFNTFKMTVNGLAENAESRSPVKKEQGIEEEKDHEVNIILGMSANGSLIVPLLVMAEEVKNVSFGVEPNTLKMLFNPCGKVNEDVALKVIKDFDEDIKSKGIPKPVVFFVNDKQDLAHFSVIEYCWENQIVIICLPPKTCKTMTPFEVSIWPKIRASYATLWKNSPKNFENNLSIGKFPALFLKAWESVCIPKQAMRSFTRSGLIPLNVPAILFDPPADDYHYSQIHLKELNSKESASTNIMQDTEDLIPQENSSLEDWSRGKLEGIHMCLEAIKVFIPPDIIPVWNERGVDYTGRSELAFKLWRSISLLLKAGCAMASIQNMTNGFLNPLTSDPSTASFTSALIDTRSVSPALSSTPRSVSTLQSTERQLGKKRKLNKSIYSKSVPSLTNNCVVDGYSKSKCSPEMQQNSSTMPCELDNDQE